MTGGKRSRCTRPFGRAGLPGFKRNIPLPTPSFLTAADEDEIMASRVKVPSAHPHFREETSVMAAKAPAGA